MFAPPARTVTCQVQWWLPWWFFTCRTTSGRRGLLFCCVGGVGCFRIVSIASQLVFSCWRAGVPACRESSVFFSFAFVSVKVFTNTLILVSSPLVSSPPSPPPFCTPQAAGPRQHYVRERKKRIRMKFNLPDYCWYPLPKNGVYELYEPLSPIIFENVDGVLVS